MKINVELNINLNCFACLGSYYIDTYTDQGEIQFDNHDINNYKPKILSSEQIHTDRSCNER